MNTLGLSLKPKNVNFARDDSMKRPKIEFIAYIYNMFDNEYLQYRN